MTAVGCFLSSGWPMDEQSGCGLIPIRTTISRRQMEIQLFTTLERTRGYEFSVM